MKEIWKPVLGYEGLYEASNLGKVKSLRTNRILSPCSDGKYLIVCLYNNGPKTIKVHKIVWEAFNGLKPKNMDIHHDDRDVNNNSLINLLLINKDEHNKLHNQEHYKAVVQFDLNNNYIGEYESIAKASRETGVQRQSIRDCCSHKYGFNTAHGYRFMFKSEYDNISS